MKNMVVSTILLLSTVSAFGDQGEMTVCSVEGVKSTNNIRVDGETMTMTVDGFRMEYRISARSLLNKQKLSRVVGDHVIEATQYVITAPQGTVGNPIPTEGDVIQLATTISNDQVLIFPRQGVVASSSSCQTPR